MYIYIWSWSGRILEWDVGWAGEQVRGGMPKRVDTERESCGPLFCFPVSQPWL